MTTTQEEEKEMVPVYLLKLKTGEVLLSEVVFSEDEDSDLMHLIHPIQVDQDIKNQRYSFSEWIVPFLSMPVIDLHEPDVMILEEVSDKYVRVYGAFVSQILINQIKMRVAESSTPETQFHDIKDAVEQIKTVSKEMSEKFDIPEIDLTEFEEESKQFKPPLMH